MKKILLAVILIYLLIQFPNIFSKFTNDDEQLYAWLSFKYFQSPTNIFLKESTDFWRPLIPLTSAPLVLFFDPVIAIRLIILLISCIGICGIYFLGKEINGELTGIISSIFLAFFSPYLYFGAKGVLDVPLAVETIFFTYFLLKYIEGKSITPIIIIAIIGFFTKQIGFAFFPLTFLAAIYKNRQKIKTTPVNLILIALMIGGFIFIAQLIRKFTQNPFANVFLTQNLIAKDIFNLVLIPFFFLGITAVFFEKKQKQSIVFLCMLYFLMPILFFATPDARLMMPAFPLLMLICGIGFSRINFPKIKQPVQILILIALATSIIQMPFNTLFIFDAYNTPSIAPQINEWITKEVTQNDIVVIAGPSELIFREVRLATETALNKKGNNLSYLTNKEEFEAIVKKPNNRAIVIVFENLNGQLDSGFNQSWIYMQEKSPDKYLTDIGFKKINSFERTKPLSDEKYEYLAAFELNK